MIANNLAVGFSKSVLINKVDLISVKPQNKNESHDYKINYIEHYFKYIDDPLFSEKEIISLKQSFSKFTKILIKPKLIRYYIFKMLKLRERSLIKKIKILNLKNHYDIVIALSSPIDTINLLVKSKIKSKIIWYQLDPYYNHYKHLKNNKSRYKKESLFIKKSNLVLIPEWYYDSYLNEFSKKYHQKIKKVGFPLDIKILVEKDFNLPLNKNKIFLYPGTFYKDIRTPDRMLFFLDKVFENNNYLFVYAGNSGSIVKNTIVNNNLINLQEKTVNLGSIDSAHVNYLIDNSDVLINVDNTIQNQIPSKLIQYIFSNKTIISFSYDYSIFTKKYLKSYKNSLIIEAKDNLDLMVKKFCQLFSKNTVSYNTLSDNLIYFKFDYISKIILFG